MTNQFSIRRVESSSEIKNPELRHMIEKFKVVNSEEFIALASDGSEAGFLSIDDIQHHSLTFIYMIFVFPKYRGFGLGSSLLSKAEDLAREKGYKSIWLRPRVLDRDVKAEWLIDWYARNGYEWSNDRDHMGKTFQIPRPLSN